MPRVFSLVTPVWLLISCVQCGAGIGHPEAPVQTNKPSDAEMAAGRLLFLKNCAHCHGADAHGDEGPDLHGLNWTDQQIATRIRNGKKGQMTAFHDKLSQQQVNALIAYIHSLK